MATDQAPPALPGDVIQDSDGHLYLATETHRWGVGAVQRWRDRDGEQETYHRLDQRGSYAIVGAAPLLPPEVQQARADAIRTAREVARERNDGAPLSDTSDPFQWAVNAVSHALYWGQDPVRAIAVAAEDFARIYPGGARELGL
jgi:hypothetical protein